MRWCLMLALVVATFSTSQAVERCFSRATDPGITITDDTNDGRTLVERANGKTTVMTTMGGGTGMDVKVAMEEDGTTHTYTYVGDALIMDMLTFELGCPGGHTWVDNECLRILISQVDAYAKTAEFYYLEPGEPLTNCFLPTPLREGSAADLECSSGRALHMDASEYPTLTVDGREMLLHDGPLPCGRRARQPSCDGACPR